MRFHFLLFIGISIQINCSAQLCTAPVNDKPTITSISISKKEKGLFSSSKNNAIGVFDRDSIMSEMPEYKKGMAALDTARAELDSITAAMNEKIEARQAVFKKDSAYLTPIAKAFELSQIEKLKSDVDDYIEITHEHFELIKADYIWRCNDKIVNAATTVLFQNKMSIVMDKKAYADYSATHSSSNARNISNDIRLLLGI